MTQEQLKERWRLKRELTLKEFEILLITAESADLHMWNNIRELYPYWINRTGAYIYSDGGQVGLWVLKIDNFSGESYSYNEVMEALREAIKRRVVI